MTHWKLTLAYNGSGLHGWQIQPGLLTVQGILADALHRVTGERLLPQGAGRTDAGVHALGQVASFTLNAPIPAENLHRALNRVLPAGIRVLSAEPVPSTFHARHSARGKLYEYRLFERRLRPTPHSSPQERICSPFLAPFVWDCRWPLNLEAMQQATQHLLGTHDFTAMAASDRPVSPLPTIPLTRHPERGAKRAVEGPPYFVCIGNELQKEGQAPDAPGLDFETWDEGPRTQPNPLKTIHEAIWIRQNDLLLFRIHGTGFLHHMVRNLVGTLVDIGRGSLTQDDLPRILASRNRTHAGPTAPASGLYLVTVHYPPEPSTAALIEQTPAEVLA